jgi:hypothetical protein
MTLCPSLASSLLKFLEIAKNLNAWLKKGVDEAAIF